MSFDHRKYRPFTPIKMTNRQWPDNVIDNAPQWCSVDLRDGNQALINPMSVQQKLALFKVLVEVGFKEIEVGFPAASQPDFDFVRCLIEQDLIPDDVTIQVLTQAREALIKRSFEALRGANKAIMHVYNSTSVVQREQVFKLDQQGIIDIAVQGAQWVQSYAEQQPDTQWQFQYSPESFTGTEIEFAVEVCNAVCAVWQPTQARPCILNLPATVEVASPNFYADQIEWFGQHIDNREAVIISLHTHNDRGCGVAAAELGVMAGADRVEGTLLGNGERTGNMDIVTMAMNLYSQGVDPTLDFSNMEKIVETVVYCTDIKTHPRHPYAGELVFTAFSGSHQDAIKKCLDLRQDNSAPWQVAYLPIDPADVGCSYEAVIRVNSQSGKGGVAHILESDHGISLPRWAQVDFSPVVQAFAEDNGGEVSSDKVLQLFKQHYHIGSHQADGDQPYAISSYQINHDEQDEVAITLTNGSAEALIKASADGVLAAFVKGISRFSQQSIDIENYIEYAIEEGASASARAIVDLTIDGKTVIGIAESGDIVSASLNAVLSAFNRQQPCTSAVA
ncbi:2-isopropylmalate synthase [Sinobacterium norvegicum]|uniref:2-isopropylmalate synthase n=1 Tax=Sinobacterium norvegicum TaxID=1641715 RepID=A0ABM9AGG6_9GAMM|nr:2-isopropylmalate synthase [Sinobacterium norvegicum]CAH0992121.1 2-isopropylmalate synthase [Sinobacterium norvegicum]